MRFQSLCFRLKRREEKPPFADYGAAYTADVLQPAARTPFCTPFGQYHPLGHTTSTWVLHLFRNFKASEFRQSSDGYLHSADWQGTGDMLLLESQGCRMLDVSRS